MSATATRILSLDDFYRLRDADPDPRNRYELIGGEVFVTPAPETPHQRASGDLYLAFRQAIAGRPRATVLYAPVDVRSPDGTIVQPDLLLLLDDRTAYENRRDISGPPNLVVEILSPSTERLDRGRKLAFYARFGVDELWLVDGRRQTLSIYCNPVDGQYRSVATFTTPGAGRSATIPGLEVDLDALFATPSWLAPEEDDEGR